jgi:putative ABC transport system substrate-binding protein
MPALQGRSQRSWVGLKPDVILATGVEAIRAAKNATKIIPILMAFGEDPVGKGLVASLASPGENITGVRLVAAGTMAAKRVEIFKEAVPRAPYRSPKLAAGGGGASEGGGAGAEDRDGPRRGPEWRL